MDNADIIKTKPLNKISADKNVTAIAKTIPKIPNKLPCLDVSGDDNPLRANINTILLKLNIMLLPSLRSLFYFFLFFCFVHLQHSLCY